MTVMTEEVEGCNKGLENKRLATTSIRVNIKLEIETQGADRTDQKFLAYNSAVRPLQVLGSKRLQEQMTNP